MCQFLSALVRDVRGGRIMRVQDAAQIRDVRGSAQLDDSARQHVVTEDR